MRFGSHTEDQITSLGLYVLVTAAFRSAMQNEASIAVVRY